MDASRLKTQTLDLTVKNILSRGKLSSSSVEEVVRLSIECIYQSPSDTLALLYTSHKRCSPQAKISSLYVIDAVVRGVRRELDLSLPSARTYSRSAGTPPETPPAASLAEMLAAHRPPRAMLAQFCNELEAVLYKVIMECWMVGPRDQRPKVRKIIDIWSKSSTFDATGLSKLVKSLPTDDVSIESTPPAEDAHTSVSSSSNVTGIPASVLALMQGSPVPSEPPRVPESSGVPASVLALMQSAPLEAAPAATAPIDAAQLAQLQAALSKNSPALPATQPHGKSPSITPSSSYNMSPANDINLDKIISNFDASSPESWALLAEVANVQLGHRPSNEEMMAWVLGMTVASSVQNGSFPKNTIAQEMQKEMAQMMQGGSSLGN